MNQTFGSKLRYLRRKKGLRQQELADLIGVTTRSIINYEQDRCQPRENEVLRKIADCFGVSTDYLLIDADSNNRQSNEMVRAEALIGELSALFAGGRLSDEDRDAAMEALTRAYWDGRRIANAKNKD